MVDTRMNSTSAAASGMGGALVEGGGRRGTIAITGPGGRPIPTGRPGNRWPNPRELAALIVDGMLRLPARYRRGMYLDVLT
ncbi:hypothetical protein [Niveispirillum fermenti]|uniref:hypothetical protein n=1 Tax=Niveispirillum fermenti TaxID=1233113 RepID=UPI003A8A52E8